MTSPTSCSSHASQDCLEGSVSCSYSSSCEYVFYHGCGHANLSHADIHTFILTFHLYDHISLPLIKSTRSFPMNSLFSSWRRLPLVYLILAFPVCINANSSLSSSSPLLSSSPSSSSSSSCPHVNRGPHLRWASPNDPKQIFCAKLLDRLWDTYRQRVHFVSMYEALQALVRNDHMAFRTFATPDRGILSLSRIFEALGYQIEGAYHFPTKSLTALHLEYPNNPNFPKVFLSELRVWELPIDARQIIQHHLDDTVDTVNTIDSRCNIQTCTLARLFTMNSHMSEKEQENLLDQLIPLFETLPWKTPTKDAMHQLNQYSQYAAWVLIHGNKVNHMTALVPSLDDLVIQLTEEGWPLKNTIEGAPGSKLRQTATHAVVTNVTVMDEGIPTSMPWPYAYMEFCERNTIITNGVEQRFEGFLGAQATELFEMTNATSTTQDRSNRQLTTEGGS